MNKKCRKCSVILTDINWYECNKKKCSYICKKCQLVQASKWGKENRERANARHKKWAKNNPEKIKIHNKKMWLKSRYGLTVDEHEKMIADSGGLCAICKKERKLCIDHNHETGEIRGLLCIGCNAKLGWFENLNEGILDYLHLMQINNRSHDISDFYDLN